MSSSSHPIFRRERPLLEMSIWNAAPAVLSRCEDEASRKDYPYLGAVSVGTVLGRFKPVASCLTNIGTSVQWSSANDIYPATVVKPVLCVFAYIGFQGKACYEIAANWLQ